MFVEKKRKVNWRRGELLNQVGVRGATFDGDALLIPLYQAGQHNSQKGFFIRIAVGAWCCTRFFLVQIYCCILISHLTTSPNQKPLVNSFFGIADTPGVILAIDRDFDLDKMIQVYRGLPLTR